MIRTGDTVKVLVGKDVDKTGLVELVLPKQNKAIVKGINLVKKHLKKSTKHPGGGVLRIGAPINLSNLMVVCPNCKKPSRIATKKIEGKSYRICRHCKQSIDSKTK